MPPSDSHSAHRFIASDVTPETASRTRRQDPVLPKTAADSMPELSVVIVATDDEQRAVLQALVDGTGIARTVLTCGNFPVETSDPVMLRVRAVNPIVILIEIPEENPPSAMRAIELFCGDLPDSTVFAIGSLHQPLIIVNAMRAGAREYIQHPATADDLLEAFGRLNTARHRHVQAKGQRGKELAVNATPDEPRRQPARRDFGHRQQHLRHRQQPNTVLAGETQTIRNKPTLTSSDADFEDYPGDGPHGSVIVFLLPLLIALIVLFWRSCAGA